MKAIEQTYKVYDEIKAETGIDPRYAHSDTSLAIVEADYKFRVKRAELRAIAKAEPWA